MRQQGFNGKGFEKPGDSFGGSQFATSNPKTNRPLESKLPIHLVLRANYGGMRHPKAYKPVNDYVEKMAQKYGVKIYEYANVGNHLHFVIRFYRLRFWAAFIRELTSGLVRLLQELQIIPIGRKYWLYRPFTRIVRGWGRAYKTACEYVHLNWLEAEGFISRKDTKTLKDLRAIWADP